MEPPDWVTRQYKVLVLQILSYEGHSTVPYASTKGMRMECHWYFDFHSFLTWDGTIAGTHCANVFFVNVGDHWRMAQRNNHEWCIRNIQHCTKFHTETRWFLVPRASCVFQLSESGLTSSKVYRGHLGASCHGSARSWLLSTRGILNAFHAK